MTAAGRRLWALAVLLAIALALAATARAQIFIAARADPGFAIGPLMVKASVTEGGGPAEVDVLWSVVLPPDRSAAEVAQDIYFLWPGEVEPTAAPSAPDPALARYVQERGFDVIGEGRLPLLAQSLSGDGSAPPEAQVGGAPYAVFVQSSGNQGLSAPATFIRIPWTPRVADRAWLMDLRMKAAGLVKPRKATWAERLIAGERYTFSMSFNEVRERPLFAMYFAHRDRVIPLADAPSELVANFANADRLKIDDVFPPSAIRRMSPTLESTEVVSLFLDKSEGITPQQLSVQFGYFSDVQAWGLVLVPALIFVLGQAMGPLIGRTALRAASFVAARLHVGSWRGGPPHRQTGTIVPREVLAAIEPGRTTRQEVVARCGPPSEEREELGQPPQRTLVYRGRRMLPSARRIFRWLSAVHHWEVERHEVRITVERDVVRDVQASTRHYRAGEEPD